MIGLPLSNPSVLPWRSVNEIACSAALIVAPHPDDETLGCGGAIALLRSLNCNVQVLVISDGTLSHPRSQKYPADRLLALREAETLSALKLLGVEANAVTFCRMQDGSIPTQYQSAVASCRVYITEVAPQIIFLPWRYDPHADHRATWKLIKAALHDLHLSPRLIEYPIWDWDSEQRGSLPASLEVTTWRLDISTVVEVKQQAIATYRSQITDLIDDDPQGFRLSAEMLANFTRPWEVYLEEIQ
ncbi:PIG-L deacetylase family protein [Nostoc sp. UHCC 0926]|uniref:PIG-L deacetylase family protein n=1 Tax=Nostoc sp. UHCC 0926 TaxID=3025190 RepID=UPI00235ED101|nr:PIG-L deacetylase family protein [Nostoc sp. UHCC 0926]